MDLLKKKTACNGNRLSPQLGYGNNSDSQNSITPSLINTQQLYITDEAAQIAQTGKTAAQAKAQVLTALNSTTAQSGALSNRFDRQAIQKSLDLQRAVTREFGQ